MSSAAIADFFGAVDTFSARCAETGSGFLKPSNNATELCKQWGSLEGFRPDAIVESTASKTGMNCPSQIGEAPFKGISLGSSMVGLSSVQQDYQRERMAAAELVSSSARCATSAEDIISVARRGIEDALSVGKELLKILCSLLQPGSQVNTAVAQAGNQVVEQCVNMIEATIKARDDCVGKAIEKFMRECEEYIKKCTPMKQPPNKGGIVAGLGILAGVAGVILPFAIGAIAPQISKAFSAGQAHLEMMAAQIFSSEIEQLAKPAALQEQAPAAAEPPGIKPPPPELAQVPEPTPPPKKTRVGGY